MVRLPASVEMKRTSDPKVAARKAPPILLYHKITRKFGMGGVWNTPLQFRRQMECLHRNGFRTLPLKEAFSTPPGRRLIITFDDAYEGVYEYALPVLKEFDFAATVFVITDYVGRWNGWDVSFGMKFRHLSWSQMREMQKEGITFQSHTRRHPNLTWLGERQLREELHGSKTELEQRLGVSVEYLSYPFGRYSEKVKRTAQEVGYSGCFASSARSSGGEDRFAMKRNGMYITDSLWDLRAKVMGRGGMSLGYQNLKGRIINWFARGTYVVKRLRHA